MNTLKSGVATLGLSLLVAGCGGGDAQESNAQGAQPSTAQSATPAPEPEAKREWGDCDLFTKDELNDAFGGHLTFGELSGYRGRGSGCTVTIQGYEGEFTLQAISRDSFEHRRETYTEYVRQGSTTMDVVNVGEEGYLINDAQVIAVNADGDAVNVGLLLIVFEDDLPMSREQVAIGVQMIAQKALDRL